MRLGNHSPPIAALGAKLRILPVFLVGILILQVTMEPAVVVAGVAVITICR
jgi:hypothetical protein